MCLQLWKREITSEYIYKPLPAANTTVTWTEGMSMSVKWRGARLPVYSKVRYLRLRWNYIVEILVTVITRLQKCVWALSALSSDFMWVASFFPRMWTRYTLPDFIKYLLPDINCLAWKFGARNYLAGKQSSHCSNS